MIRIGDQKQGTILQAQPAPRKTVELSNNIFSKPKYDFINKIKIHWGQMYENLHEKICAKY